jgi:hypothetical protein
MKKYSDGAYSYSIGDPFDDYLIVENDIVDEDYTEIHKDDCSEWEREIYDFLYKMDQP